MAEASSDPEAPWVLPDEPVPVRLMNTVWADRHGVHDALTYPLDLARWLNEIGAPDHGLRVTQHDLVQARGLRDALRRLAAVRTGDRRPSAVAATGDNATADNATAVDVVNQLAAGVPPPRLELKGEALELATFSTGESVAAVLADVAVQSIALLTDAAAPPLRACLAPGCVLYYVQGHPRQEWCSTACGNRARAARHYDRHRSASKAH